MWQPTHVKVTVKQAKNVLTKGKNGTNDSFVVIGIGKTKFQTSVKEKSGSNVEWNEECELEIPSQGNKAGVQLTVYHHNNLGLDEFLGQCSLPLTDFDVYEKPKFRWYRLRGKPEKDKKKGEKERGELEVMVNFTVKSESILDVNKKEKHKTSLSSLKHLGGSLLSIGGKEKQGLKNFAKSVSSRMDKIAKPKKNKKSNNADYSSPFSNDMFASRQHFGEADPGVISDDDDDFRFEDDIKVNTRTSSPMSTMSRGSSLMHDQVLDTDGEIGTYDDGDPDFALNFGNSPPKPPRIIVTGSTENMSRSESRSSINTSRESSVHDIRKEDSFTRLPGVKALTLEKKPESDSEGKKQKKKIKPATAFKNRFFNSSKFDEKVSQEEGRFVEGGNDRVPSGVLGKQSRLPQEILDKFSGKTREDLIERILSLESNMARQAKHSSELEDYIDNLLLRVMEATPHILQAPIETKKSAKFSFGR